MKFNLILLSFLCLTFISCNKNGISTGGENPQQGPIPIRISTSPWMKVTDSSYENGDQVGIYTVNFVDGLNGTLLQTGNHLDNFKFTFNGDEWVAEEEAYWKDDNTPADFYCYYPYSASIDNIHAIPFAVNIDQSTLQNYKSSEFMYGKTEGAKPSSSPVSIMTKHAMSNIVIVLQPGEGYTAETLAAENITVTITGVYTEGILDLENGSVSIQGAIRDMIPYKENGFWRALVVPQNIFGTQLIKVTVANNTYTLNENITFKSGHQHKCTLTINRIGEGVNIGVEGWQTDDTDFGGVLE